MIFGNSTDAAEHQHHALQIGIGLNKSFKLHFADKCNDCRAIIIAPDQPHQFDGRDDRHIIILIDPETTVAHQLVNKYLQDCDIEALDFGLVEPFVKKLQTCIEKEHTCKQAREICDNIVYAFSGPIQKIINTDHRIQKVFEILALLPEKKMSTKTLSDLVCLSESRLIHLFKEQAGIPIRRYILWLRLIEALKLIFQGVSFTTAAHQVEFADSAHLSRTFKKMFGMKLSNLFKKNYKNSQFVQVITCLD